MTNIKITDKAGVTLKTAGKYCPEDIGVIIDESLLGGASGQPIEVNELPETGEEGVFYKLSYSQNQLLVKVESLGMGILNLTDGSMGMSIPVEIVENYPDNPIVSDQNQGIMYAYYISSLNNIYLYMDNTWATFDTLMGIGLPCLGIIDNANKLVDDGYYVFSAKVEEEYKYENSSWVKIDKAVYKTYYEGLIRGDVEHLIIPENVTFIRNFAFGSCAFLKSVEFEDISKIVNMETNYLFCWCESLTDIELPSNLYNIGDHMFCGCSSLENIIIPDSVEQIDSYAFSGCSSLKNITIPNNVKGISNHSFYGCSSLESINIPDSVVGIGASAFHQCSSLKSIELPSTIENIWASVFSDCISLESISLPSSIKKISEWAFSGCKSLKSIVIPNNVTNIGQATFQNCSSLTEITIPNKISSIGDRVFEGCSNLKKVVVENGNFMSFPAGAFKDCSSLDTLVIRQEETVVGLNHPTANSTVLNTPLSQGVGYVYVPDSLVDSYKSNTYWGQGLGDVNTQIKPLSEYVEE